ncbi:hypothetical protein RAS2_21760 [Phycisphaerae bacterium RAS2]|nr:hypothetical protein RAS2_21760 [Phycisphaerae bacterium RAS2]
MTQSASPVASDKTPSTEEDSTRLAKNSYTCSRMPRRRRPSILFAIGMILLAGAFGLSHAGQFEYSYDMTRLGFGLRPEQACLDAWVLLRLGTLHVALVSTVEPDGLFGWPFWGPSGGWAHDWYNEIQAPQIRWPGWVGNPADLGHSWQIDLPLWIPLALGAVWALAGWHRGDHIALATHCKACGYDLTGNVSGRCPECGDFIPSHPRSDS